MDKRKIIIPMLAAAFLISGSGLAVVTYKGIQENAALSVLSEQVKTGMIHGAIAGDDLQILPQYRDLYQQNSDMAGWIEIEGTKLDYPVMYTPEDVEYYLERDFDKMDASSGIPFIGYGCSVIPQSDNLLIYGHNMKNGTMFNPLLSYKDKTFWQEHPIIKFDTLYEEGSYEIMAVFPVTATVGNGHFEFYNFINAESQDDFNQYVNTSRKRSLYDTGVIAEYGDKLITLSTCSYHSENGRFVIVAKKESDD